VTIGANFVRPPIFWLWGLTSQEPPIIRKLACNSDNCQLYTFLCPRMCFIVPRNKKPSATGLCASPQYSPRPPSQLGRNLASYQTPSPREVARSDPMQDHTCALSACICLYQQPSKGLETTLWSSATNVALYHRERPPRTEYGTVDCLVVRTGSCSVAKSRGNSYGPVGAT